MLLKHIRMRWFIGTIVMLLACSSGNWLNRDEPTPPTPTFELARYTTPTVSLQPSQTATPLPATATPSPTTTVPPTPDGTTDNGNSPESAFQSPLAGPTSTATASPTVSPPPAAPEPAPETAPPTATARPTPAALRGRIAFPLDDGGGFYDVWMVELPDGEPFLVQPKAHQPNFSKDGRLLVKVQKSDQGESIGLLDANHTWQGILNESPDDSYPFWHPDGNRYAFSNGNLIIDPDTAHLAPFILTACSLQLPKFENDVKCRDTRQWGIEVGEAPVWTDDDRLVFFSYKGDDGLYFVENASLLRQAGGLPPKQFLVGSNGRPSDTAAFRVFFSAGDIEGNWEAYAVDLDGSNLVNLSQSPASQDGLPTVSPDGNWLAFVSDRDGSWGIWVTLQTGGEPVKIADLSAINPNISPWGVEHRAWMTERISWGPER